MKKLIKTFLIIVLLVPTANSQSPNQTDIIVGLNQFWVEDAVLPYKPGLALGIGQRIGFTKNAALRVEILGMRNHLKYVNEYNSWNISTRSETESLFYSLKLPVMLQLGKKTYFGIGAIYGFNLGGKTKSTTAVTQNDEPDEITLDSENISFKDAFKYKDIDVALSVGRNRGQIGWEIRPTISFMGLENVIYGGLDDTFDELGYSLHFLLKYRLR